MSTCEIVPKKHVYTTALRVASRRVLADGTAADNKTKGARQIAESGNVVQPAARKTADMAVWGTTLWTSYGYTSSQTPRHVHVRPLHFLGVEPTDHIYAVV